MGTTGGNSIARVLRSSDPRRYDRVDWVFALGFVLVVVGSLTAFWSDSIPATVSSIVGMFIGVCVMLLCLGVEAKSGASKPGGARANDAFKDGDAFEEDEMGRGIGRKKGPKGRT